MAKRTWAQDTRLTAKMLFRRGFTMAEIMAELKTPERTLYRWREKDAWDQEIPAGSVEEQISRRICFLVDKPIKTKAVLDELGLLIDKLGDLSIKLATARQMDRQPDPDQEAEAKQKRGKAAKQGWEGRRKKKGPKNDISAIAPEQLDEIRNRLFWRYQLLWWEQKQRNRFILKSRQIGATYYFAWEALEDAIKTGDNQIFLSASRDQAEVFRAYIIMFGTKELGIEITGNPIILSNGAELRFLSTNSRTAQSYHGHLYLDEVFWVPKFAQLWKVASGMSAHKKWRRTLFSTPSALSHEAYAMWSGENFNKGKPDHAKKDFDVSHKALKDGWLGPDRIWRNIVTVEDAEAQGCDLFDIEELRTEYSEDDFNNLFMCQFIDDAKSVFPLWLLLKCCEGVDRKDWEDYNEEEPRPYGNKPVSIGYDPSRSQDKSSKAVLAVPIGPRDKWRVLRRDDYRRVSFDYQANRLKDDVKAYNVVFMGIDITGIGYGVYELAQGFYPSATPITYSVQEKTKLVMKALEVMHAGRFQYDSGDREITRAFLMVRETTTAVTSQITYVSGRDGEAGHAEAAWSIMNGLSYESINAAGSTTTVSVCH